MYETNTAWGQSLLNHRQLLGKAYFVKNKILTLFKVVFLLQRYHSAQDNTPLLQVVQQENEFVVATMNVQ